MRATITTNEEPMLLTIKGKWLEAIVHMTKFRFLALPHLKQVQFLISIRIHNKFHWSPTFTLIGFHKDNEQFLSKMESSLRGGDLVIIFEPIVSKYDVQCSVKHKIDFDWNGFFKKTFQHFKITNIFLCDPYKQLFYHIFCWTTIIFFPIFFL